MSARKLLRSSSMDELRQEIIFTKAALAADPGARHLVQKVEELLKEWARVNALQLFLWDGQTETSVRVACANRSIEDRMDAVHALLLVKVGGNRNAAEYVLYIPERLSDLKKPVLGTKLELVRKWPKLLEREKDPNLKALIDPINGSVVEADAAVEAAKTADNDNREFRLTGDLAQFHVKVENTRDELFRLLDEIRQQKNLPRDYASTFFRKRVDEPTEAERKARAEAKQKAREAAMKLEEEKREARRKLLEAKRELEEVNNKKKRKAA